MRVPVLRKWVGVGVNAQLESTSSEAGDPHYSDEDLVYCGYNYALDAADVLNAWVAVSVVWNRVTRQAATDREKKRANEKAVQRQKELESKAKMRKQQKKELERCKREAKKKQDARKAEEARKKRWNSNERSGNNNIPKKRRRRG